MSGIGAGNPLAVARAFGRSVGGRRLGARSPARVLLGLETLLGQAFAAVALDHRADEEIEEGRDENGRENGGEIGPDGVHLRPPASGGERESSPGCWRP